MLTTTTKNKIPPPPPFRHGTKFSYILYVSLASSTAILLFWLVDKVRRALFSHVLASYLNLDNLERVVYANTVTISQKKQRSLINTNKVLLSAPFLFIYQHEGHFDYKLEQKTEQKCGASIACCI